MILGLLSANGGITVGLWKLLSLDSCEPPWHQPQSTSCFGHCYDLVRKSRDWFPGFLFLLCSTLCLQHVSSFSSAVNQQCLDSQWTCCQELGSVAKVFCCSPQLVGGWHPVAITGVSITSRGNSPGGCGGPSDLLLCNHKGQSMWCQFTGALSD